MNKFKVGQKVYVKRFGMWGRIVKFVFDNRVLVKFENGQKITGPIEDCEKFIEPKYKVGQFIRCYPNSFKEDKSADDVCEIVKTSLNKKAGEYSYLAFNENGSSFAFNESSVILAECTCDEPVVEMTIKQLEDLFESTTGGKLKIIK